MNTKQVLFVAFLAIFYTCVSCKTDRATWGDKKTVIIRNDLSPDTNLEVHCKSKDDDLGNQVLSKGQTFRFSFRVTIAAKTLFFCRFQWRLNNGSYEGHWFVIFDGEDNKRSKCATCTWEARTNQICRHVSAWEMCFHYNPDKMFRVTGLP